MNYNKYNILFRKFKFVCFPILFSFHKTFLFDTNVIIINRFISVVSLLTLSPAL